jgi:hypothetical protein
MCFGGSLNPKLSCSIPGGELTQSQISFDEYNWNAASQVPSITLQPGQHFDQTFTLNHVYRFEGPGTYEVTFDTVISVLVGAKNGAFAKVCPLRLTAQAKEVFIVSGTEHDDASRAIRDHSD